MPTVLRVATTVSDTSFRARYGNAFVWHAALAFVAWGVLAPVGHAMARFLRRTGRSNVRVHRVAMIFVLGLTIITWYIGVSYANRKVPPAHAALGTLVAVLALLQGLAGAMRPPLDAGGVRAMWVSMHRGLGGISLAVAMYTVHHSISVFKLSARVGLAIDFVLAVAIAGVLAVEIAPEKVVDWVGRRPRGYFGDVGDDDGLQVGLSDEKNPLAVEFKQIEDEDREEDVLALDTP